MDSKFSTRMKSVRRAKGYSQRKLAELVGVSTGSVSAYELGRKMPPVDVAARMAAALEVSLDWLVDMSPNHSIYQKPENYGDLLRLLVLFTEALPTSFPGTRTASWREDYSLLKDEIKMFRMEEKLLPPPEEEDKYPPLQGYGYVQTRNPTVVNFIDSWLTMYLLKKDGGLLKAGYDHWIKERLRALSYMPLPNYAPKPEEE